MPGSSPGMTMCKRSDYGSFIALSARTQAFGSRIAGGVSRPSESRDDAGEVVAVVRQHVPAAIGGAQVRDDGLELRVLRWRSACAGRSRSAFRCGRRATSRTVARTGSKAPKISPACPSSG